MKITNFDDEYSYLLSTGIATSVGGTDISGGTVVGINGSPIVGSPQPGMTLFINYLGSIEYIPAFINPMTTAGDIVIGGTRGAPTRLAAGTATYVLTSNGPGTAPSWQASAGGGGGGGGVGGSLALYHLVR